MLGVEIKKFQNLYSVKRKDSQYCCCNEEHICEEDITHLKNITNGSCPESCQTDFLAHVQDCTSDGQCTIKKTFNLEPEIQFGLRVEIFQIPFVQPPMDIQVRTMY